jgi:hypothetical protein
MPVKTLASYSQAYTQKNLLVCVWSHTHVMAKGYRCHNTINDNIKMSTHIPYP